MSETQATESNENRQNPETGGLSDRQRNFIPLLVTCATFTEACEKGKVNRTTLYEWLRDPTFKAEVERQRQEIAQEARGLLTQNLTAAVETLTGLLDTPDDRLKRLVAKDVVEIHAKQVEMDALEARLSRLEAVLKTR